RVLGEHFDQGKTEGGGFAGAGLGKADDVSAFKKVRDCLRLDRRRRLVAECKESGYELLGQAKLMEIRQVEYLFGAPKKIARYDTMPSGFLLASRTPREMGTCKLEIAFQRVNPQMSRAIYLCA